MDQKPFPETDLVTVNGECMRELTRRYARYRRTLTQPGDPVIALTLIGDILKAVQQITTGPAHPIATPTGSTERRAGSD